MKRVLLINSLGTGGAQTQLMLRLKQYVESGDSVVFYRGEIKEWNFSWLPKVHFIPLSGFKGLLMLIDFLVLRDFRNVEIWSSSLINLSVLIKIVKPQSRITLHERTVDVFQTEKYRIVRFIASPILYRITTNNRIQYNLLVSKFGSKAKYMSNLVEKKSVDFSVMKRRILLIGRFSAEKRMNEALSWISVMLSREEVYVYGSTYGENGYYPDYMECLKLGYINENVKIFGSVERGQIKIGFGNVLVHFARIEGCPNAVLEAINSCCWVILRNDSNFHSEFDQFPSVFIIENAAELKEVYRYISAMSLVRAKTILLKSKAKLNLYDT